MLAAHPFISKKPENLDKFINKNKGQTKLAEVFPHALGLLLGALVTLVSMRASLCTDQSMTQFTQTFQFVNCQYNVTKALKNE